MGWKGTGKYICGGCKAKGIIKPLTEDNCSPSVFKRKAGSCRECMRIDSLNWSKENRKKRRDNFYKYYHNLSPDARVRAVMIYHRTVKGRHAVLKSKFKTEEIPDTDVLLNLRFYTELIRDNECHYCLGPLGVTSHGLDRIDNYIGHRCFNVVPCCKSCNQKKMNDTTYEEMMLLAPALREIRRRREALNVDTQLSAL